MRTLTAWLRPAVLPVLIGLTLVGARAQGPGMAARPPGWNAAFAKIFADIPGFSAEADMRMLGAGGQETMNFGGVQFQYRDAMVRIEIDMGRLTSSQMPPGAAASMKQMGMDRMVNIVRPDKKQMLMVYPGMQAYVEMDLPADQAVPDTKGFKIEKTKLGDETLDGEKCEKQKVVITDAENKAHEVIVWTAPALKDFPVQVQFLEGGNTIVMRYRNIQLKKPDADLFDPPAGFTRHASPAALMQSAMQKMMANPPR